MNVQQRSSTWIKSAWLVWYEKVDAQGYFVKQCFSLMELYNHCIWEYGCKTNVGMHTPIFVSLLLSLVTIDLGVRFEGGLIAYVILVHLNLKGGRRHSHVKLKGGMMG